MVRGIRAHFNEINQAGGIHKQKIEFIVMDDGYDPESAKTNMQTLVTDENILAIVGNVGTPTAKLTMPLAIEYEVPLIGVLSGADLLRNEKASKQVINFRASYAEEMSAMINAILSNGISVSEIAFFTQDDSFGVAGFDGGMAALNKLGITNTETIVHARYPRNTLQIEPALIHIITSTPLPKAIIIVGTYGPAAKFIKLAQKLLPNCLFFNISFVGSHALAKALNGCCNKVYVSQVVPPLDQDITAVKKYKAAIQNYSSSTEFDDISFEGYLVAKMLTAAMKNAEKNMSRNSLIKSFEDMATLDLGMGENLHFDKTNHQGSHQIWLTRIKDNNVVSSNWSKLD